MPGGIDVHTHLNMPFGGTTSADDFESGTIAAAFGGTTSLVDFAIQYRGQTMRHALDDWMKRADGKAVIDYGFHMIVTELEDAGLSEMDRMVRDEGITSFKLFMAYPGVFMVDDQTIFRALRRTGENGGLVCMHAENGGVIDELVKEALRKGHTAPKYHALTRPAAPRVKPPDAPSRWRKWPASPFTSSTCPPPTPSKRSGRRATWACPPTRRRARSTCSCRTTTTRSRGSMAPST